MELRLAEVFANLRSAHAQADAPLCAYVYDLAALRRHAANLADSLPDGCELFYAIKANSDLPILQTLAPLVAGFEVSSGGELAWVREHFAEVPVIFSGPGKLDHELRDAIEQNVDCLHAESLHELQRLANIAGRAGRTAPVSLRINCANAWNGCAPAPRSACVAFISTCCHISSTPPPICNSSRPISSRRAAGAKTMTWTSITSMLAAASASTTASPIGNSTGPRSARGWLRC